PGGSMPASKSQTKKHPGAHRAAGCLPPGSIYTSRGPGRRLGVLQLVAELAASRQETLGKVKREPKSARGQAGRRYARCWLTQVPIEGSAILVPDAVRTRVDKDRPIVHVDVAVLVIRDRAHFDGIGQRSANRHRALIAERTDPVLGDVGVHPVRRVD